MLSGREVKQKKEESDADFQERRETSRRAAWLEAETEWQKKAEARLKELQEFVDHYEGEFISGLISDLGTESGDGMIFADSVQVRLQMSGAGFHDVILNFAHLFDVALPPELQEDPQGTHSPGESPTPEVQSPDESAPTVCVIDSGIQQDHLWLEPAIDDDTSRCFFAGCESR